MQRYSVQSPVDPRARPVRGGLPRGLVLGALIAVAGLAAADPASGQRRCDPTAGTLGIQGMRCEGCTFRMSRSGIEEARFRTEPEVLTVARGFTRGDELRAGDRIVSLDDVLVTTRAGGNALASIQAGQPLVVRVRRDGRLVDLRLVAGSACALREAVDEREVEVERVAPLPPGVEVIEMPPLPEAPEPAERPGAVEPPEAPVDRAEPALPALPEVPAEPFWVAPPGYLGFGFSCSQCAVREGRFEISSPIVVEGVSASGPAARAGLRSGDRIVALDGIDITDDVAGRRFAGIQPGDTVRLTVRREDARRTVTLVATERLVGPAPLPPAPRQSGPVQFEGKLGDVGIEVRGVRVTVTRMEGSSEIVIRTGDAVIRLRKEGN